MPPAIIAHVKATAHDLGLGVIRSRASTLGSRLHLPSCFSDDDSTVNDSVVRSLSRAYSTARAQPLSARRTRVAIDDDSVQEMQVYRHPPPSSTTTEHMGEEEERWVARNRDPYRDEEYLSYSSTSWGESRSRPDADGARGREARDASDVVVAEVTARRRDAAVGGERRRAAAAAIRQHDAQELEGWLGAGQRDFGFTAVVAAGRRNAIAVAREPAAAAGQDGGTGRSDDDNHDGDDGRGDAATSVIPPLPPLKPLPRRRCRPSVRDTQRRSARIWDEEDDNPILFTGLENATAIATATETISPHLSGPELERRGPPPAPAPLPTAAYEHTDTSLYRGLYEEQRRRKRLPRPSPPPPEPAITIQARICDGRVGRRRNDEEYRAQALILREMFRPVVGLSSSSTITTVKADDNILARVGGYLMSGAETVAEALLGRPSPSPSSSSSPPHHHHQRKTRQAPPTQTPPPSSPSTTTPSERRRREEIRRKTAAALILTDQEFPLRLTRDGPGSRLPSHLLLRPITTVTRRQPVPSVVRTSPSPPTSALNNHEEGEAEAAAAAAAGKELHPEKGELGETAEGSSSSAGGGGSRRRSSSSSSSNNRRGASRSSTPTTTKTSVDEEEWVRLTVRTAEWVPFPGAWAERWTEGNAEEWGSGSEL
ncbi:MAG: hypothetical protein Q9173_005886 [Seirophora scorigena]